MSSLTTDLWYSITMESYLSFTVHYIRDNWKLRSIALQTVYMPQDHTGLNLAEVLCEALESWGLSEENLVCQTKDSGANIISAAQQLEWSRLSCFGHSLHNAVNIGGSCSRILLIIFCWDPHLVQQPVTRECCGSPRSNWYLARSLRFFHPWENVHTIFFTYTSSMRHPMIPTWQDLDVLESIKTAPDPLSDFTDVLSGEDGVTVSSVKPVLHHLTCEVCLQEEKIHN